MRRLVRRTGYALAAVLVLAVILVGAGWLYLRQSLPDYAGEVRLSGLSGPVDIVRDRHAIPHIYATSWRDAYFALGYAHAQDRLWQMEMNRRIAAGRISEVVGAAALDVDKLFRTIGFHRVAAENLIGLDAESLDALQDYSSGVNAYLQGRARPLPPEFHLFGIDPEPWQPVDSVAWGKMMQWDLSGNWRSELLRLRLSEKLTPVQLAEFLPPFPGDPYHVLPDLKKIYRELAPAAARLAQILPATPESAIGSNNWVVSGAHTASGKPLLANDPHLGLQTPAIWYFAHLSVNGENVIGATLPGTPVITIGRNDHVAWGVTNTGPDVQDLYLERLQSAGSQNYLTPQGWEAFTTRNETIKVRGGESVEIQVRESRHGPVISDAVSTAEKAAPADHVLALQWTASSPKDLPVVAFRRLQHVRNWEEFTEALRDFYVPQQNFVYADTAGNTGFIAPGKVPIRHRENGFMGLAPVPGWDAKYDWQGYIPFEELPRTFNPASGVIATANDKITPPEYKNFIAHDWAPPFRVERIRELAGATTKHDKQSFSRMHGDVESLAAKRLLPLLLKAPFSGPALQPVIQKMKAWNAALDADRPEPLIYWAWLRELTRLIYADELGAALFKDAWEMRAVFVLNVLSGAAGADGSSQARWCDDVTTAEIERCDQLVARALPLALADLSKRYGNDQTAWAWGQAHVALSEHRPLGQIPLLRDLANIRIATGGDAYTVNTGANRIGNAAMPFANRHAASLRMVVDMADLESSGFIHSTGQSGNLLSSHYSDFAKPWAAVQLLPMMTKRSAVESEALGTLKLRP